MEKNRTPFVYNPVNHCIYCGEKTGALSNEHIIPYGLGGNLILPKSSCKKCSLITSRNERLILRLMYGRIRNQMHLPSRRGKNNTKKLVIEVKRNNGNSIKTFIDPEEYPKMAIGYKFETADFLRDRPLSENSNGEMIVRFFDENYKNYISDGNGKLKIGSTGILSFCQFLAKIGHSYAVAKFGDESFTPFLKNLILGDFPYSNYYVGGDHCTQVSEGEDFLHEILPVLCEKNGVPFLIVAIRLFANLGMPRYHVVVGRCNPSFIFPDS